MIAAVPDTHAALWLLFGDLRLSTTAKNFFDTAADEGRKVCPRSVWPRSFTRSRKSVFRCSRWKTSWKRLKDPDHILEEGPFMSDVVAPIRQMSREAIPD